MNHSSIYQKSWLDLVFEGKNKSYGAYVLRKENNKTTVKSFFTALLLIGILISFIFYYNTLSAKNNPITTEVIDSSIVIVDLHPIIPEPLIPESTHQQPSANTPENNKSNLPPVAINTENANTEKEPEYGSESTTTEGSENGMGINTISNTGTGNATTETTGTTAIEAPEVFVDKKAEYPGGIKKFYDYIGKNFNKNIADEKGATLTAIIYFIIEKDGSMSSIKVVKESRKDVGLEAIRVLKKNTIKWKPALKNNNPVRTVYTIPITITTIVSH
jgi:protein TonB